MILYYVQLYDVHVRAIIPGLLNEHAPGYVNQSYTEVLSSKTRVAIWPSWFRRWLIKPRVEGSNLSLDILWFIILLLCYIFIQGQVREHIAK